MGVENLEVSRWGSFIRPSFSLFFLAEGLHGRHVHDSLGRYEGKMGRGRPCITPHNALGKAIMGWFL